MGDYNDNVMNQPVLITGATGYLGQAVAREGIARGYQVRGLCRRVPNDSESIDGVEYVEGDITKPDTLATTIEGCSAVIHCAGLVSIWHRDPAEFDRVNVDGTRNVIDAANVNDIERVILVSSFFALGPTKDSYADEDWLTDEDPPTPYARSKRKADLLVRERIDRGGNLILAYPCVLYGPGRECEGNLIGRMMGDFMRKKIPGLPGPRDRRLTFTYLSDAAQGLWLALEKGRSGERYILGGQDATLPEVFDIWSEFTGVKAPRWEIPYPFSYLVALLSEAKANILGGTPSLTRESLRAYQEHWRFTSHKAVTELGYSRTPLKIGMLKTLASLGFAKEDERSTIL